MTTAEIESVASALRGLAEIPSTRTHRDEGRGEDAADDEVVDDVRRRVGEVERVGDVRRAAECVGDHDQPDEAREARDDGAGDAGAQRGSGEHGLPARRSRDRSLRRVPPHGSAPVSSSGAGGAPVATGRRRSPERTHQASEDQRSAATESDRDTGDRGRAHEQGAVAELHRRRSPSRARHESGNAPGGARAQPGRRLR